MDISFDIYNDKGDHLRVALSYYDMESVGVFTSDPLTLSLTFYDVTLIRMVRLTLKDIIGVFFLRNIAADCFPDCLTNISDVIRSKR